MTNNAFILETIKSIVYPWIKEAASEAIQEQNRQMLHRYPEKVTVAQASEITGYSRNSIYQMHSKGSIPGALKIRGKLLFDTETLRRWVNSQGKCSWEPENRK